MEMANTYQNDQSRNVFVADYESRCYTRSFLAEVAPSRERWCPGLRLFLTRKETVTSTAHGCVKTAV